jgi:hypothetical protein
MHIIYLFSDIEVESSLALPGFPAGPATLRHLLLLWTGDHACCPGQGV